EYEQMVERLANALVHETVAPYSDCPKNVDWHEVAAGVWPEMKATQLISHAALCGHCGPLLRAATVINAHSTPYEETLIADLRAPSRPVVKVPESATSWWSPRWLIPVAAFLLIFTLPGIKFSASPSKLSGLEFAQFAVKTYKQHEQGALSLDFRSDSQQSV